MIKFKKRINIIGLKNKTVNTFMASGKKRTGEKILLKVSKLTQRLTHKNSKSLIQLAIINSTPTFKLNEQSVKKGKRKSIKSTPSFLNNDSLRIMASLKFLKNAAHKNRNSVSFYQSLVKEIQASASLTNSQSVEQKNELQKQILINKRYLSKFRW